VSWGLEDVTVTYGALPALDRVSVGVESGTVTAVVGADGAGKTTVARALVGLVPLSGGQVSRPESCGFQPETSGVWSDLTVDENLAFVAGAHRLGATESGRRIDTLLGVTGLGSARDRLGRHLSGGMRQKLGVAMALLPEPELLVLDEPTTGLDPVSRLELWAFIASAAGDRAVLVTTAYVNEAARASTIVALEGGKVLASGPLDEVIATVPGRVFASERRLGERSWRRGRRWRVWSPDGTAPEGAEEIEPDLSDAVTAAAMAREVTG
jgi:ABC-2 type transport system ATP-binding protein